MALNQGSAEAAADAAAGADEEGLAGAAEEEAEGAGATAAEAWAEGSERSTPGGVAVEQALAAKAKASAGVKRRSNIVADASAMRRAGQV